MAGKVTRDNVRLRHANLQVIIGSYQAAISVPPRIPPLIRAWSIDFPGAHRNHGRPRSQSPRATRIHRVAPGFGSSLQFPRPPVGVAAPRPPRPMRLFSFTTISHLNLPSLQLLAARNFGVPPARQLLCGVWQPTHKSTRISSTRRNPPAPAPSRARPLPASMP